MSEDTTAQDGSFIDRDDADAWTAAFVQAAAAQREVKYVLTLYVAGVRSRSQRAIESIRRMCEEHLPGRYELQIIDIYQQPALAQGAQIIAVPTLVKKLPLPLRQIIGDMTDDGRLLVSLGIKAPEPPHRPATPSPGDAS
jgi:circadian clock protein KaiB